MNLKEVESEHYMKNKYIFFFNINKVKKSSIFYQHLPTATSLNDNDERK